jgi:hypothetical protein
MACGAQVVRRQGGAGMMARIGAPSRVVLIDSEHHLRPVSERESAPADLSIVGYRLKEVIVGRFWILSALALTGCLPGLFDSLGGRWVESTEFEEFDWAVYPSTDRTRALSSSFVGTSSLALQDGRAVGVVGDMVCGFRISTGDMDFDESLDDVRVEDGPAEEDDRQLTLLRQGGLVRLAEYGTITSGPTFLIQGLRAARWAAVGGHDFVALVEPSSGGCVLDTYGSEGRYDRLSLTSAGACGSVVDLEVDRVSGRIFVGLDAGLFVVEDDIVDVREPVDLVRVGAGTVAWVQDGELTVEHSDGLGWTAAVTSPIVGLGIASDEVVVVQNVLGSGRITRVDAVSGGAVDVLDLPVEIHTAALSRDGRRLGVSARHSLAFYALD